MKHAASLAAALAVATALPATAQQDFGPLIAPAELAAALDAPDTAPLLLDIRMTPKDKPSVYDAGHIPGAVAAPYASFRGPKENPGQLVPPDRLTDLLRALGVRADRPTVVIHAGEDESDFGAAARVYWTLKSSGVSDLAILNGGMKGWEEAGLPLSTETVTVEPSQITVTEYDPRWLATQADVEAAVAGQAQATLIDARGEDFWKGNRMHGAAAKPGTLPQSDYLIHSTWFTDSPTEIDADAAQALAAEAGYGPGDQLVSFCNTGHWAATNWFALSELAGIEGTKLYPESMVGWSNAGLPMDNTPGMIRNLWNQLRGNY